ncbi:MAG: translesion error-prone DNA polymerase V autoproteolytic subunit [Bacteroidales bacterium]|nr:translesion error-prone DNA polymerase V autoproteolytic subunit [Bacteroidales bacterium]
MSSETKLTPFVADTSSSLEVGYSSDGIHAGFPSPAQNYMNETIDLNRELIRHRETTFYARVEGDSMKDAGIGDGDIVIIDKSLTAKNGDFVAAYIDGEFALKQFQKDDTNQCVWLIAANSNYPPIKVTAENNFIIWGVITYTIKKMR